ncbi:hypothetical protein [Blautia obeum]|uniref:hypothetical protein n=1 Tax=Blautia obeum TaxID=40520 RepID=UPI000E514144|nr:hypothetical protein [Blautia obeum]RHM29670.1 hypothetical protein DWZ74_05250 [Blautia obeum]
MDEIEINIGGIFEQRRLESMQQIGETEAVAQDNRDLEELQWRYENLQLTGYDRNIIDDLIFCMRSRSERVEQLAYYAGASDTLEFIKKKDRFSGPFSTFKYQLLSEQTLHASKGIDYSFGIKSYTSRIIVDTLNNKSWKNSDN